MKNIFLLFTCLVIVIGFTSCGKEYTCACTFTDTTKNFEVKLEKMRKNDAVTVCKDYSAYVGNCGLK